MKPDEELTKAERNARAKVRAKARAWMRDNPLRGPVRRALFELFAEILEEDGTFYPGVRWLAWRIGTNTTTVTKHMKEFADKGLIVLLDRKGRGGSNRYRLDYSRSLELYPDTVTREQFRALNHPSKGGGNDARNAMHVQDDVSAFEGDEVCSEVEHFEPDEDIEHDLDSPKARPRSVQLSRPKCVTFASEVCSDVTHRVLEEVRTPFQDVHRHWASRTTALHDPDRTHAEPKEDITMTTETEKPNNDDADAYEGAVQKRRAILIEALARRRRMPTRKETLQALNAHMNALAFWGVTPGMIDLAVDRAIVEGRRTGKRVTVDFVTDIACDLVGERPDELVPVNVAHAASKEAVNHD